MRPAGDSLKRKYTCECVQSDDSTICFSSSDSEAGESFEIQSQVVSSVDTEKSNGEKKPKIVHVLSETEDEIEILEVEEGPVDRQVEIVGVEKNSTNEPDVQLLLYVPPSHRGKCSCSIKKLIFEVVFNQLGYML